MKQHIGPIYLILGLMAASTLTIGAGKPDAAMGEHRARAQELLPSPLSFQSQAIKAGKAERILVIGSDELEADVQDKVEKAIASAKAQKAG